MTASGPFLIRIPSPNLSTCPLSALLHSPRSVLTALNAASSSDAFWLAGALAGALAGWLDAFCDAGAFWLDGEVLSLWTDGFCCTCWVGCCWQAATPSAGNVSEPQNASALRVRPAGAFVGAEPGFAVSFPYLSFLVINNHLLITLRTTIYKHSFFYTIINIYEAEKGI